ncbi:NADH-quinone oxidoreductase subunit NuoK [Virgibacillus sp. MSP4-1]|uniref:NADH-quinone oxidoreductase subunit NuoK n=1 Tax=Virgibacillus sp. MSP4-1 TaxID=2700081 RepID=UPI0003A32D55|nr:NADH-quinone oxidoreductase subunit NuoK [Virgibacillus sp. MSP4-1]QHS23550.1 NADH-quinone oxidoreductase subunit NuoK [Virgibacillus sp. MSP4-1]
MSSIPLQPFLILALILFCIGLFGALTKRNTIIVLICIELMLNAVNVNLVAFSKYGAHPDITGQVFSLFSITIAAAEVAVGMAILIAWYRRKHSVNIDEGNDLKD